MKKYVVSALVLFASLAALTVPTAPYGGLLTDAHAFFGLSDGFQEIEPQNGQAVFAVADVSDGKAHFYKYEAAGKEIHFFILKSSDGVIRAAFDACDVCYPEKKGYEQDGDFMVCRNCGRRFHSAQINVVQGGCNPSPLNRAYDEKTVTIAVSDIESGAKYF